MSAGHTHAAHDHESGPVPVVCARRYALSVDGAGRLPGDELAAAVRRFLDHLLPSLRARDCRLIGHVKGLVDAGEAGRLHFSVTSFRGEPSVRSALQGPVGDCTLTVNAIVFGGDEEGLAAALASARRHLAPWQVQP